MVVGNSAPVLGVAWCCLERAFPKLWELWEMLGRPKDFSLRCPHENKQGCLSSRSYLKPLILTHSDRETCWILVDWEPGRTAH